MSFNNNKVPAKWVHSFNIGDGTRVHVSEKGAIKLTTILPSGEEKFMTCLTPVVAKALVNAAGDLGNFLLSDTYKAIEDNKGAVKEREKIAAQLERFEAKRKLELQAALDKLTAAGYSIPVKIA